MLAVPLKKSRPASVKSSIVAHLKKGGGYDPAFDAIFDKFDDMREQAIAGDAKLNDVKTYLAQILYLDAKFPVVGPSGGEPEIDLEYNWRHAFLGGHNVDGTFVLEKAAIFFNLAALHMREGQKLDDPVTMKICCDHWANAAAMFKFIRVALLPKLGGHGGTDLTVACLQTLQTVCYAAVQGAVFHRAESKGMKAKNLASISAGAAELLQQSNEYMRGDPDTNSMLTDIPFGQMLPLQLAYFRIASNIHKAEAKRLEAEEAGVGYGVYVARLRLAISLIGSLKAKIPHDDWAGTLRTRVGGMVKVIQDKLTAAEEENRLLYVEQVPAANKLADIRPHLMKMADDARAEPFDEGTFLKSAGPNILGSLSPELMKLKKMVAAKAEQLKDIGSLRSTRSIEAKAAMDGPGAANAGPSGGPTPELWAKVADFHAKKGLQGLQSEITSVQQIKQSIMQKLDALDKQLAAEAANDQALRAPHGSLWTLPPSASAAQPLKATLGQFRQQVNQAAGGDAHTAKALETHKELLQWLSKSKADLEAEATATPPGAAAAGPNPKKYLDTTIAKLKAATDQSDALFEQLLSALSGLDIDAGVAALPKDTATVDPPASVSKVLAHPLQLHHQLTQALEAQAGLVQSTNALRTAVNTHNAKSSSSKAQQLEALGKRLHDGVARASEISAFIGQGKNYYTSLQTMLPTHMTSVAKYCSGRSAAATAERQAVVQRKQHAAADAARQQQLQQSLKQAKEREAQMQLQRQREAQMQAQRQQQAAQLQAQRQHEAQLQAQREAEARRQQEAAARQRAFAPPAAPAGLMSLTVTIPHGTAPGGQFRARLPDGRECVVSVPVGMYPGGQLTINVPAAPPPLAVPAAPTSFASPPMFPAPTVPPRGSMSPAFNINIYSGPQRTAIEQMKNFTLKSTYEQCTDYLLRHGFDVQQAVQAYYHDHPP